MRTFICLLLFLGLTHFVLSQEQIYGVDYGIKRGDGSCATYEQVLADMQIIKTFSPRVRIYSVSECGAGDKVVQASKAVGLQVLLGVQPGPDYAYANDKNALQTLFTKYSYDNIIAITVGSEALYREDLTSEQLAAKINEVRTLVRGFPSSVPIATSDVYYKLDDTIINSMDIVMMNAFPFWQGVSIDEAVNIMFTQIDSVKAKAKGKTVWVGETGWPTAGQTQANAVASMENMQKYLNGFICRANSEKIPYFWFEAFDELWKDTEIERSWGLYGDDRKKKSGYVIDCTAPSSTVVTDTTAAASSTVSTSATTAVGTTTAPATTTAPGTTTAPATTTSVTPSTTAATTVDTTTGAVTAGSSTGVATSGQTTSASTTADTSAGTTATTATDTTGVTPVTEPSTSVSENSGSSSNEDTTDLTDQENLLSSSALLTPVTFLLVLAAVVLY